MLIRGYGSVFDTPDKIGDIVVAGAFSGWIKATGGQVVVPVYWMHDYNPKVMGNPTKIPVGATTVIRQTNHGLWFEGELGGFPKAAAVAELVMLGAARGSSIGYKIDEDGAMIKDGNRYLTSVSLGEISITSTGMQMHPQAYVEPFEENEVDDNDTGAPTPGDIDNA